MWVQLSVDASLRAVRVAGEFCSIASVTFSEDICPRLSISGIWCAILSFLCFFHGSVYNYLHPVHDTQLQLLARKQIAAN